MDFGGGDDLSPQGGLFASHQGGLDDAFALGLGGGGSGSTSGSSGSGGYSAGGFQPGKGSVFIGRCDVCPSLTRKTACTPSSFLM